MRGLKPNSVSRSFTGTKLSPRFTRNYAKIRAVEEKTLRADAQV
jgi:hypothetical protein